MNIIEILQNKFAEKEKAGLTKVKIATDLKMRRATVSTTICGKSDPRVSTVQKLLDYLNK